MNYSQTLNYIHSLPKFGPDLGLHRMRELMRHFDDVHQSLNCIHVAGTNGKGSVCTMLSNAAQADGKRVGLYTSPFIIDFRDRIMVNGKPISEDDVVCLAEKIRATGVAVNEFQFITAMAFLYFAQVGCDIVVLETGLGGLLDPTNIISKPLCSVITRIDYDHTEILGDSIEQITRQKMGIAKPGRPIVVSHNQMPEVVELARDLRPDAVFPDYERIQSISSDLLGNRFIYKDEEYILKLGGAFQIDNAVVAIEAATISGISKEAIKEGLSVAVIPSRVEIVCEDPLVVLDGAHNPNSTEALAKIVETIKSPRVAVIAMMKDKDCRQALSNILGKFDMVVTTQVKGNPRSYKANELAQIAREFCLDVVIAEDYSNALKIAKSRASSASVFVFGSLYLTSDIRKFFF